MAKDKLIKCQSFSTWEASDWFMLPSTKGLQEPKYKHEVGAADLFVAFYPFMTQWAYEPPILDNRADRGIKIYDKVIYFEVDRGTEPLGEIEYKVDKYISSKERCYVIFVLMDGKEPAQKRGEKIIPLLAERKRGNQFLIASHKRLCEDPLGRVIFSPLNKLISLKNGVI